MASPANEHPRVDIKLSITPSSYAFTEQSPPTMMLELTSHAEVPTTFATWGSPLDIRSALTRNGCIIIDRATESAVPTTQTMVQRGALMRIRGTFDERYLLTLEPHVSVTLTTPFGRNGSGVKSQPKAVVQRGWKLDEHGNERKIRRSTKATGVDGLEPGHQYLVKLNYELLKQCKWTPARKEEVLIDRSEMGSESSHMQDYPWEMSPVNFCTNDAFLDVLE
ncbi:hypothetical protein D6D17_10631 [Aureobasidium pullulans]|nr:hypothetical protein D6D17_10631 [Aureobasidium pullulans]